MKREKLYYSFPWTAGCTISGFLHISPNLSVMWSKICSVFCWSLSNHPAWSMCDNCKVFVSFSSGFQRDGNPEKEEAGGTEGTAMEPDCLRWSHSVQWLDLGQSSVFSELFGQFRTLLWTLCSKALWLQLHVPRAGSTAGSINLQDIHRSFQIIHKISQASKTGKKIMSSHINGVEVYIWHVVQYSHLQSWKVTFFLSCENKYCKIDWLISLI